MRLGSTTYDEHAVELILRNAVGNLRLTLCATAT